jgi:cytochrome P450
MSADAQAVPEGLTPLNPEVQRCPYDWYDAMHSSGEGAFDAGPLGYVVAGHAEISKITFDTTGFSSEFYGPDGPQLAGVSPEPWSTEVQEFWATIPKLKNALFSCDPPTQTRQKAIANKSMNITRVRKLEPTIRAEANALIDAVIDSGRADFFAAYATPLPVIMIATMLGMDGDRHLFKKWSDDIADGYLAPMDNVRRMEVLRSSKAFIEDLLPRIEERRANPTDDLLSALVNSTIDEEDEAKFGEMAGPRHLTDGELLCAVSQLLPAGNHTTTNLLANLLIELIEAPEVMAELRANPELIPVAIDESLRKDSPLRATYRVCTRDAEVSGTKIPAGSLVPMMWGGAGHDPDVFPEPQRFDIHRPNVKKHIAFGHGPHVCVGMPLARAVSRISFEVLLERIDNIRFADGVAPTRAAQFPFSAYEGLEIEFDKKA